MKSDEVYLRDIWMDERPKDVNLGVLIVTTSLDVQNMCVCVHSYKNWLGKPLKQPKNNAGKSFQDVINDVSSIFSGLPTFLSMTGGGFFHPYTLSSLTKSPTVWAPERATMSLSWKPWEGWKLNLTDIFRKQTSSGHSRSSSSSSSSLSSSSSASSSPYCFAFLGGSEQGRFI